MLDTFSLYSSYLTYDFLDSVRDGAEFSDDQANAHDDREAILAILTFMLFIFTVIFFSKWIYRISWNAHYFSSSKQRYSPRWAVGYYFIPFANLWRPYQALKDAYETFVGDNGSSRNSVIIPLWWFAWIVTGGLNRILASFYRNAEDIDDLIQVSLIQLTGDFSSVLLDAIAFVMILMVTRACYEYKKSYIEPDEGIAVETNIQETSSQLDGEESQQ